MDTLSAVCVRKKTRAIASADLCWIADQLQTLRTHLIALISSLWSFFLSSFLASFLTISLFFFFCAGCTKTKKEDSTTVIVALAAGPNTLDPRFTTDAVGTRLAGLMFNSLVRVGPELKVVGDAATSWDFKDLEYTFQLRPGLRFVDGTPVTGQDLLFSFDQYRSARSPFHATLKSILKVEAHYGPNEHWIRVKLSEFSAIMLANLGVVKILPKHLVERDEADFARRPVGTGPFQLIHQDATEIRLKARADHPYAAPKSPFVVFKIIRDDNTRFFKTFKGEVDIVQNDIPPSKVRQLEKRPHLTISRAPGLSMTYLLLNLKDPALQQLAIRKALSQAIRRDEIIRYKLDGLAQPATSILTPANPFFNSELKEQPFDLDAAKKAIRDAGLVGREFILKTSNIQTVIENGRVIAAQLEAAGLKVKLQSFEWGTFYSDVQKGNFQLALMKWVGSIDPDIYRTALHSHETPENMGRNRGRYANTKLDRLVEDGLRIADPIKRIHHYQEVQQLVYDDLPYIPLWYDAEIAIIHKRIKDYIPSRNGDYSSLVQAATR